MQHFIWKTWQHKQRILYIAITAAANVTRSVDDVVRAATLFKTDAFTLARRLSRMSLPQLLEVVRATGSLF